MPDTTSTYRKPDPKYLGKNGYFDHIIQLPAEDAAKDAMQIDGGANGKQREEHRKQRKLRDAIERHVEADEALDAKGIYFPG